MAKDLEYYLAQARRIAAHREAGAEKEIRKLYKTMLKDLQTFVADTYVKHAKGDVLTFAMLQEAAYNARFLEEIEQRISVASRKEAKVLHELVNDTYKIAYDGMVQGVIKAGTDGIDDAFADAVSITPRQIKNVVNNYFMDVALEKNRRDIMYEIKQAVGVGLMNGDRYTDMARRIAPLITGEKGAYMKALRIARTETHRVVEAGNSDAAQHVDKELQNGSSGLRMTKTWMTMGDERVRPQRRGKGGKTRMGKGANHIKLHGQTVLADQPFDLLDGNSAMAPGQSGVAGHDINCRCIAAYEMMKDAEYHKKTGKHFPDHKGEAEQETDVPAQKYTKDHDCELAKQFGTDHYDAMHDMVVNCPNEKLTAVWKMYESQVGVGNAHHSGGAYARNSSVYLDIDRVAKGNSYEKPYQTAFHEVGHAIDSLARSVITGKGHWGARHYSSAYKDGLFPQTIKDEVQDLVKVKDKELKALFKKQAAKKDVRWFYDNGFIDEWYYQRYLNGTYEADQIIPKYAKAYAYSAVKKEVKAAGTKYAIGDLSDILEGATGGKIACGIGHGKTYWKDRTYDGLADGLATEAFAEMIDSSMASPESLEMIKKYLPKTYDLFLEMIENLVQ